MPVIPATGGALNNNSTLGPLGSNAGLGPDTDTDHADPVPPRVDGAPNTIWLNYGDIDHDCTHAERYRDEFAELDTRFTLRLLELRTLTKALFAQFVM